MTAKKSQEVEAQKGVEGKASSDLNINTKLVFSRKQRGYDRRDRSVDDIDKDIHTLWQEIQELDKLSISGR